MRTRVLLSFIAICSLITWACQPDEELLFDEPTLRARFIDAGSLASYDSQLVLLDTMLSELDSIIDTVNVLASIVDDSVVALQDLIENEEQTELQDAFDLLSDSLAGLQFLFGNLNVKDSTLNSQRDAIIDTTSIISSGSLVVTRIENPLNGQSVVYDQQSDSSVIWPIPLNMNADQSQFDLTILDQVYSFGISYQRETVVDEFSNVIVQASNIQVSNDPQQGGFDSLEVNCINSDCIDREVELVFYF